MSNNTSVPEPVELTDAEIDKVTGGQGFGVETAHFHGSAPLFVLNQVNLVTQGDEHESSPLLITPGHGKLTAL
jgi:hypothetical protein